MARLACTRIYQVVLKSKGGSCPAIPMGSRTVRAFAAVFSLLSHTTGFTPGLTREERWLLEVMSIIGFSKSGLAPKMLVRTALPTESDSGTGVSNSAMRAFWMLCR
jgi:hypothetical protein